jgi:hypothetical protein
MGFDLTPLLPAELRQLELPSPLTLRRSGHKIGAAIASLEQRMQVGRL